MSETKFAIAKLNNANFQTWKYKVELLLIREDLWHVVKNTKPENPDERWAKADRQARVTIGLLLKDDQLRHIKDTETAKDTWEALKNYYEKASLSNQVFLLKRLCSMKLADSGNMEEHINAMLDMVDKLAALGEALKDKLIIAMLLSSLPESYNSLITILEARSEADLTLALVKGKLIEEYRRRKNQQECNEEQDDRALKVQQKRFNKELNKTLSQNTCFFCKKSGHQKKDCIKYKKWKAKKEQTNQATNKEQNKENEVCFSAKGNESSSKSWCIDFGVSCHMTNDRSLFKSFSQVKNEKV